MILFRVILLLFVLHSLFFIPISYGNNSDSTKLRFFDPSLSFNKKRFNSVFITESSILATSFIGFNELWYKNYSKSSFHLFNDSREWLLIDKLGHAGTVYYFTERSIELMQWTGVKKKKAIWLGIGLGQAYLLSIEILDGFSEHWGFSLTDVVANTSGSLFWVAQNALWKEQRINFKYSFHHTIYQQYRPDLLGNSWHEAFFKDYNGQSGWFSISIEPFLKDDNKFPKWLCLSLGYGAEGMTGAEVNSSSYNGQAIPYFNRYPQYYLSLDIELKRIKTRYKWLNYMLKIASLYKIPFPALEWNKNDKFIFHPLYY
jgi:hypothetical protein